MSVRLVSEKQAVERAAWLNATVYKKSRISVRPMKFGRGWVLVGYAKVAPNVKKGACEP